MPQQQLGQGTEGKSHFGNRVGGNAILKRTSDHSALLRMQRAMAVLSSAQLLRITDGHPASTQQPRQPAVP